MGDTVGKCCVYEGFPLDLFELGRCAFAHGDLDAENAPDFTVGG